MFITKNFKLFSLIAIFLLSSANSFSMETAKQFFNAESAKIGIGTAATLTVGAYGFDRFGSWLYPKPTFDEKPRFNNRGFFNSIWKPALASGVAMVSSMRLGSWAPSDFSELLKPFGVAFAGICLASGIGAGYGYMKKPEKSVDKKSAGQHFQQDDENNKREFSPLEKKQNAINCGYRSAKIATLIAGFGVPCCMLWQRIYGKN